MRDETKCLHAGYTPKNTEQGVVVIAAGAFLAEHSVFPSVAAGRPDAKDKAAMEDFENLCAEYRKPEIFYIEEAVL